MNEPVLLERTSRSFYLTLRLLPRAVRGDASLGYLLARATDTIADTSARPVAQRAALLRSAAASLGREAIEGYVADDWSAAQGDPAERELLGQLPELWRRFAQRPDRAKHRLIRVMSHILDGQIFDLERFAGDAQPLTDEELERYAFLVAGCVGEFWTDLCADELRNFSHDPVDEMRSRARRYGQALQLVNILRDRRMDAALGRVYVREEDVARWRARAREWLSESAPYCAALRSGRLRYATLLPALLGWRTLACDASRDPALITPAKVPRSEVRRCLLRALPVWWSRSAVRDVAASAAA
ncbi:MAG: phytoene/squalene synthase family protein [Chthoniobacterales bacterium]